MVDQDTKGAYELTLTPGGADTTDLAKEEFNALVREAFEEEGQGALLQDVRVKSQRPFPDQEIIKFLIWFGSQVALEIFKRKVLPKLEERFDAWWSKKDESGQSGAETPPDEADKK